jgi:uncharacterized protein YecE (DUF72 family)
LRGADALLYDPTVSGSLHIGTSGYSFPDWVGTIYPPNARPADFLGHYAEWFDTVEVNATYYRIPTPRTIEAMRRKAPEAFTFTVKLPKEMTHQREGAAQAVAPFLDGIAPLRSAEQLGAVLAQFPFSFKRTPENERHIERIAKPFREAGLPIVVEFRHDSWYDDAVFERLRDLGVGFVNVDLPDLPALPRPSSIVTSEIGYIRLHGRNAAMWWEHPTPSDRYDYLYDDGELDAWAQRIEAVADLAKTTFVFNNNCHLGQSVVNALQLHQRLGLPRPETAPGRSAPLIPQTTAELADEMRGRIASARRASSTA